MQTPNLRDSLGDHAQKQASTDNLLNCDHLRGGRHNILYRLFYVSRNLEHAFANKPETLTPDAKMGTAARLATKFAADPQLFRQTLEALASMHGNPATWRKSWEYARYGVHSLERGSNLAFAAPWIGESLR